MIEFNKCTKQIIWNTVRNMEDVNLLQVKPEHLSYCTELGVGEWRSGGMGEGEFRYLMQQPL